MADSKIGIMGTVTTQYLKCGQCGAVLFRNDLTYVPWFEACLRFDEQHASHERGPSDGPLTHQMAREFMAAHGGQCVYCGSGEIVATEQVQMDGATGHGAIRCPTCGRSYMELYALVGVADEDGKDPA